MDARGTHVFISHGSENRPEAAALSDFLESNGIKTWIAPRDVRPGTDYSEELQAAIETSLAFVVLISEKSNKSPYVRAETEIAFSTSTPIYPVRNSDIQPAAGLAFFLKIRHWTDAFGEGRDAAMARLVRELQVLTEAKANGGEIPQVSQPPLYPTTPPATMAAAPRAAPPPPAEVYAPPPAPPAPAPAPTDYTEGWASTPPTGAIPAARPATSPPGAGAVPATAPVGSEADQQRAYIGPNADYFLAKWRQSDATNTPNSWNWAAFFLTVFWLAYRKMWVPMAIGSAALFALRIVGGLAPPLALLTTLLTLGVAGWIGWTGNALYRKAVESAVAEARRSVTPPHSPAALLQLRGGVSLPAALGLAGGFFIATLVVAALMIRNPAAAPTPAPPPATTVEPTAEPAQQPPDSGEPDKPN